MGIKVANFEFSSDFLDKSEADFKAHMKRTHGVSAKKAKELYKGLHGESTGVPNEAEEAKQ